MPSAELKGKVSLDGSGFERTLKTLSRQSTAFVTDVGKNFTGLKGQIAGAFSAAAAGQLVNSVVKHVERIKDLSDQYHVTTKEVQELDFAMTNVGLKFEDLGGALTRLGEARKRAREGDEEAIDAFKRMGVSLKEIENPAMRNVDVFYRMSAQMKALEDTTQVQNDMFELMGRSGSRLTEAMRGLNEQVDKFKGLEIPQKDLDNIDEAARKVETLGLKLKALGAKPLSRFLDNPMRGLLDILGVPGFTKEKSFRGAGASGSWGDPVAPPAGPGGTRKELAAAQEKLQDLAFGNESSPAKKLQMLQERRSRHEFDLLGGGPDSLKGLKARIGLGETEKDLMSLIRGLPQRGANLNELQRVGAYAGPKQDDSIKRTAEALLKAVREIEKNTKTKPESDIF